MKKLVFTLIALTSSAGLLSAYAQGDAPYGKLLIGTKWPQSKPYWEAQGIQPVIDITNDWLLVGHVDELFMPISNDTFLYASPWQAADLLHIAISIGATNTTLWCGWTNTNAKVKTVVEVAVDGNKLTRLLAPIDANSTVIACGQALFAKDDYLRIGDEILYVTNTTANGYAVERAQAGRPATPHASNDVIYALSLLMRKNLLDGIGDANNKSVANMIRVARRELREGMGGRPGGGSWFLPVPVLFNNGVPGYTDDREKEFSAYTSNLANCLFVNQGLVYYPDPGCHLFKTYYEGVVPGAVAVNVWDNYHCLMGEIHCATATIRELPPAPPWWEQVSATNVWRNER